ncbi:MAG: SAM-dependent chlorinase/fluorinase [Chloroflexi bacterium]|nr:SAM-dependent chlorinase/fluorinase [Chloroflexota bacterium]
MGIITLMTDFGEEDSYVAEMKGVILSICPNATLVDITHHVRPQDIRQGAFVLAASSRAFPMGTVHLAVVDPGVGTERRPIAVQTDRGFFVAPDNGLLSFVLADAADHHAVVLSNQAYYRQPVSQTFHGRDIFAPAAAYIHNGVPLQAFGPDAGTLALFPVPRPRWIREHLLAGEVLHTDAFGNVITNIRQQDADWARFAHVQVGRHKIRRLCRTYAEGGPREVIALFGSSGYLELAQRDGCAARRLRAGPGTPVRVAFREPAQS